MAAQPSQVQGLRAQNRRVIMAAIRNLREAARVDIARVTGISAATVTSITADLVAEGLVFETVDTAQAHGSGRGRPRILLRVRPDAFLIAGAKISSDHIAVTITDYAGDELLHLIEPLPDPPAASAGDVSDRLWRAVNKALAQLGKHREELASVGVGLPGFVDSLSGRVHWSACFQERNVDFLSLLRRNFHCPVSLDNDANLVALAEKWFGFGRGVNDFIVVTIEHGVGMGVILDGAIFRGARGIGTEFGHTKVQHGGALCRCGQRGCLEAYVADYALAREAPVALGRDFVSSSSMPQVDLDVLYLAARNGNALARSIFERAGDMFAMGLANLVNIFDPSLIIIAGEQLRYDYLYDQRVIDLMLSLTVVPGRQPPEIRIHRWGDRIWARGAAALAIDAIAETSRVAGAAPADLPGAETLVQQV